MRHAGRSLKLPPHLLRNRHYAISGMIDRAASDLHGSGLHDVLRKTVNSFGKRGGRRKLGHTLSAASNLVGSIDPRLQKYTDFGVRAGDALAGHNDLKTHVSGSGVYAPLEQNLHHHPHIAARSDGPTGSGIRLAGQGISLAGAGMSLTKTLRAAKRAASRKNTRALTTAVSGLANEFGGKRTQEAARKLAAAEAIVQGEGLRSLSKVAKKTLNKKNTAKATRVISGLADTFGDERTKRAARNLQTAEQIIQNAGVSGSVSGSGTKLSRAYASLK